MTEDDICDRTIEMLCDGYGIEDMGHYEPPLSVPGGVTP